MKSTLANIQSETRRERARIDALTDQLDRLDPQPMAAASVTFWMLFIIGAHVAAVLFALILACLKS